MNLKILYLKGLTMILMAIVMIVMGLNAPMFLVKILGVVFLLSAVVTIYFRLQKKISAGSQTWLEIEAFADLLLGIALLWVSDLQNYVLVISFYGLYFGFAHIIYFFYLMVSHIYMKGQSVLFRSVATFFSYAIGIIILMNAFEFQTQIYLTAAMLLLYGLWVIYYVYHLLHHAEDVY